MEENANIAKALNNIALQLSNLGNGNAVTNKVGAIERLGMMLRDKEEIDISNTLEDMGCQIKSGCEDIAEALNNVAEAITEHGET